MRGCPYKCMSFILLESSGELCVPSSFLGYSSIAARMPGFSAPRYIFFLIFVIHHESFNLALHLSSGRCLNLLFCSFFSSLFWLLIY